MPVQLNCLSIVWCMLVHRILTSWNWTMDNPGLSLPFLSFQESLPTILWNRRSRPKREHSSDASSEEGVAGEDHDYFPASRLYEYRWPVDQERAELYFLQEQVAEFLKIRGIQRKYPDMLRRSVDVPEKKYLMSRGVVTETQSNMGLVAVRSDDVLEIMSEDFPEKYQEYMVVVQEREFQNTLQLRILEARKIALMTEQSGSGGDVSSVRSGAVREVVEFNKKLALQRRQQHSTFYDRQTKITHVPRKALRVQPPPKQSRYPVALIPGQYSDYCHRYTPKELFHMPLNTAFTIPEKPPDPPAPPQHTALPVTAEPSMLHLASSTPSTTATLHVVSHLHCDGGSGISGSHHAESGSGAPRSAAQGRVTATVTTRTKPLQSGMVCTVCYRGRASMRQEQPEQLLQCSHCKGNIHPSCVGMSSEAAGMAVSYPWQCLECKTCSVCQDPGGEEEMVFCDHCDRGYHSFCLNMKGIPEGRWLCMECCSCASCGSERGRGDRTQWNHEFLKEKFVQTLCIDCSRYFHREMFCPVCNKVYYNDERDLPMVLCGRCNRKTHVGCSGNISEEQKLSMDHCDYICLLCTRLQDT